MAGGKEVPGAANGQEIEEGHLMSSHGVMVQVFKITYFLIVFSLVSALKFRRRNKSRDIP